MQVAFAAIGDAANISQEGKLNITGIFDTIKAANFPCTHLSLVFAFRMLFEYPDRQKTHHFDVSLVDQDGVIVWGAGADVQVGSVEAGRFVHSNQIITLRRLTFPAPGRYRFRIQIRGEELPHDSVFQVVKIEE